MKSFSLLTNEGLVVEVDSGGPALWSYTAPISIALFLGIFVTCILGRYLKMGKNKCKLS